MNQENEKEGQTEIDRQFIEKRVRNFTNKVNSLRKAIFLKEVSLGIIAKLLNRPPEIIQQMCDEINDGHSTNLVFDRQKYPEWKRKEALWIIRTLKPSRQRLKFSRATERGSPIKRPKRVIPEYLRLRKKRSAREQEAIRENDFSLTLAPFRKSIFLKKIDLFKIAPVFGLDPSLIQGMRNDMNDLISQSAIRRHYHIPKWQWPDLLAVLRSLSPSEPMLSKDLITRVKNMGESKLASICKEECIEEARVRRVLELSRFGAHAKSSSERKPRAQRVPNLPIVAAVESRDVKTLHLALGISEQWIYQIHKWFSELRTSEEILQMTCPNCLKSKSAMQKAITVLARAYGYNALMVRRYRGYLDTSSETATKEAANA